MGRMGISERMSGLGDRARDRMAHRRIDKLERDNDRLRGEVATLQDDLHEERDTLREALKGLRDGRGSRRDRRRPHVVRTVIVAAGAYVLGARAGRERYERIVDRARAIADDLRKGPDDEAWETETVDRPAGAPSVTAEARRAG
jgi:hypothetical protein